MKAMILAAGKGSRLSPLTDKTPKPLLPIQGRPLIEYIVKNLAREGYHQIVINLHHLGDQIIEFLGDGSRYGVNITYSLEEELLETGGGIKKALNLLGNEPFLIVNGDIYTDFRFSDLPEQLPNDCLAHLVVRKNEDKGHGDFEIENSTITSRGKSYTYCGIAVIDPKLFYDSPEGPFSWTRDWLFDLLASHYFTAQEHRGRWADIGTIEQYESLQ